MSQESTEHALQVARWVVQGGADRAAIVDLYVEYCAYLAQGVEGTFTQLLYVRGMISKELFDRMEVIAPPPSLGSGARALVQSHGSGVFVAPSPPPHAPPPGTTEWGSGVRKLPANLTSEAIDTTASDRIRIPLPLSTTFSESIDVPDEELNQATMRFAAIIPPGTEESTEFHPMSALSLDSTMQDLEDSVDELSISGSDVDWEKKSLPLKPPKVGGKLGDYELVERLGRGGMGLIFKARGPQGQDVALKVLLPKTGPAGEKARVRFEREVKALSLLEHRNLVGVRDSGNTGPFQWYVMDYVEGRSLQSLIGKPAELQYEARLGVFLQVCDAIIHAHSQGVIHRDLKPGNVIIDDAGRAIVLDLGLAKITGREELTVTRTGTTLGTPFYMAPEQLLNPRHVDTRADVWTLGVLLYELVTTRRPFNGETFVEISKKIVYASAKPPSAYNSSLPKVLDRICARAMAKKPGERYSTVADLRDEVGVLHAQTASKKTARAKAKAKRSTDRHAPEKAAPEKTPSDRVRAKAPAPRKAASGRVATAKSKSRIPAFLLGAVLGIVGGMALTEYAGLRLSAIVDWVKDTAGVEPSDPIDETPKKGK